MSVFKSVKSVRYSRPLHWGRFLGCSEEVIADEEKSF